VEVIGPAVEGLGDRLGPILFQFAPQDEADLHGGERFAERLQLFLTSLPRGPDYCVELRNRGLLSTAYREALNSTGASHCFNAHPAMPEIREQMLRLGGAAESPGDERPLVVRWMLHRRYAYEEAKAAYAPFDRLVDADPGMRRQIATVCHAAGRQRRPAYVIINTKAEGSAPLSVLHLAQEIRRLG
jgi:uncharacterized protein YecE (DUF72 family)